SPFQETPAGERRLHRDREDSCRREWIQKQKEVKMLLLNNNNLVLIGTKHTTLLVLYTGVILRVSI
ncbi:MAG TPA: hypothetical protein DIS94_05475, partial [Bacteroidetes bacterium]|nr:hypothetical protein [Bacteroidota bacterium]